MHVALVVAAVLGFQGEGSSRAKPPGETIAPDPAWKELGRSLWFDAKTRRVYLKARVVLRDGYLEHLMCSKGTKEHESILATDAVPFQIRTSLILTEAEPGKPAQFVPEFKPPTGDAIAIEVQWKKGGKVHKQQAREWVTNDKGKVLDRDWVFAGSQFYDDQFTKTKRFAADDGDLITVANFASAILDLPIESSNSDADRSFKTNTPQIPELGTEVLVAFYPRNPKPAGKPPAKPKPAPPADKPAAKATSTP